MKFRTLTIPLIIISMSSILSGCGKTGEQVTKNNNEKVEVAKGENFEILSFDLYFDSSSSEDSLSLNKEERNIKEDDLIAKAILDELIKGPDKKSENTALFPKTLKITSLSIKDSIAYVSFDNGNEAIVMTKEKETLALKAIITTLTQLDTIDKVKITVPNSESTTFAGNIDIAKPMSKDDFQNVIIK